MFLGFAGPSRRRYEHHPLALEAHPAHLIAADGTARFTAHSAFEDPTAPADVLPRESIEVRTLVFHNT